MVVDEPQGFKTSIPPMVAATSPDLAMIRFHGRNAENWQKPGSSAAERFRYLYSEEELEQWVGPARELAARCRAAPHPHEQLLEEHGIRNAAQIAELLAARS